MGVDIEGEDSAAEGIEHIEMAITLNIPTIAVPEGEVASVGVIAIGDKLDDEARGDVADVGLEAVGVVEEVDVFSIVINVLVNISVNNLRSVQWVVFLDLGKEQCWF